MKLTKFLVLIISVGFFACNSSSTTLGVDVGLEEIKRISSDDKKVDAVLIETDGGATTAASDKVFIVKRGEKIIGSDIGSAIFNCDHFSGVDIRWTANKQLLVTYENARIFNYTNFWESDDVDHFKYKVNITLLCNQPPASK